MIREGDAVVRYLQEFQVWHWGIVVKIVNYTLDGIWVMEFTDADKINLVTLRSFCWLRKYFWVHAFEDEMRLYGRGVFRSVQERINVAYQIFQQPLLTYRIDKYNCEYFVRRCVFVDSRLWESQQTKILGSSFRLFAAKMATVMLASTLTKFSQRLDLEKNYRTHDMRYEVDDNSITFRCS